MGDISQLTNGVIKSTTPDFPCRCMGLTAITSNDFKWNQVISEVIAQNSLWKKMWKRRIFVFLFGFLELIEAENNHLVEFQWSNFSALFYWRFSNWTSTLAGFGVFLLTLEIWIRLMVFDSSFIRRKISSVLLKKSHLWEKFICQS